ncbi:hypothetical protein EVAR_80529_1 [Eumeta japonica]|uniref:Uncharacterized protein n=1 Tax=Eumeta variegata TaxID=151549 RepID=A0A4C1TNQ5_EUMVA|nr:hypothetical protein EVAR_80529_1 [Eumeta japonica]
MALGLRAELKARREAVSRSGAGTEIENRGPTECRTRIKIKSVTGMKISAYEGWPRKALRPAARPLRAPQVGMTARLEVRTTRTRPSAEPHTPTVNSYFTTCPSVWIELAHGAGFVKIKIIRRMKSQAKPGNNVIVHFNSGYILLHREGVNIRRKEVERSLPQLVTLTERLRKLRELVKLRQVQERQSHVNITESSGLSQLEIDSAESPESMPAKAAGASRGASQSTSTPPGASSPRPILSVDLPGGGGWGNERLYIIPRAIAAPSTPAVRPRTTRYRWAPPPTRPVTRFFTPATASVVATAPVHTNINTRGRTQIRHLGTNEMRQPSIQNFNPPFCPWKALALNKTAIEILFQCLEQITVREKLLRGREPCRSRFGESPEPCRISSERRINDFIKHALYIQNLGECAFWLRKLAVYRSAGFTRKRASDEPI